MILTFIQLCQRSRGQIEGQTPPNHCINTIGKKIVLKLQEMHEKICTNILKNNLLYCENIKKKRILPLIKHLYLSTSPPSKESQNSSQNEFSFESGELKRTLINFEIT